MIQDLTQCEQVNETLKNLLNKEGLLWEAARYAVLGGGKRLRPRLTLVTAEALGADPLKALYPAAAIEMIHAYSLVHDDLPCMDDDDLRRGRPTVHKAYDEATAVLVGDLLLTYAFEVIASSPDISFENRNRLSLTLSKASGGQGLIEGQYLDLAAGGKPCSLKELENIHLGKTASLIAAAVTFGGIVAGINSPFLTKFGQHLGLAFQIVDDVLDVTHSEQKHGRATDIENDKATYVKYLGVEGARQAAEKELSLALDSLDKLEANTDALHSLAIKFVHRKS